MTETSHVEKLDGLGSVATLGAKYWVFPKGSPPFSRLFTYSGNHCLGLWRDVNHGSWGTFYLALMGVSNVEWS